MRHLRPTAISAVLLAVACTASAASAADTTTPAAGTVTGKVVWDFTTTSVVHGAVVELRAKADPVKTLQVRTSETGEYSFPAVPFGEYVLKVSDPSTPSFAIAPAEKPVLVDGDEVLGSSVMQADVAAASLEPCTGPQDAHCVVDVSVTLPGKAKVSAQYAQPMGPGGSAWNVPGTGDEATGKMPAQLELNANWATPWSTSAALGSDFRAYGASITPTSFPGGAVLPDDAGIALQLRGVPEAVTSYVFANARDTVFAQAGNVVTLSGKPIKVVDGPIPAAPWNKPETSTEVPRRIRTAWSMTASRHPMPCVPKGDTLIVSTNSFRNEVPTYDTQTKRLRVQVAGTHYLPGYDADRPEDNKVNHTGYFQVALPTEFVTSACGWGTTVEEVLRRAKAAVSEDDKQQQVKSTARMRANAATGKRDLVVTVDGFHYSTPTVEVASDGEPRPIEDVLQEEELVDSTPTPGTSPVFVPPVVTPPVGTPPVVTPPVVAPPAAPRPVAAKPVAPPKPVAPGTVTLAKPAIVLAPAKDLPVTGTIAKAKAGTKVTVQVRQKNGTWVAMGVTRTNAKGEFTVGLKAPAKKGVYTYRVQVPGTKTPQVLTVTVK